MKKTINIGEQDKGGKLIPTLFDYSEGFTSKWIPKFLFWRSAESGTDNRVAGYISLPGTDDCLVEASWSSNGVHYHFYGLNYLTDSDLNYINGEIKTFFKEKKNATIQMLCANIDSQHDDTFKPDVSLYFYTRMAVGGNILDFI